MSNRRGTRNGNRARVAAMHAEGWPPRRIAADLAISISTVYVHLFHIRRRELA